MRLHAKGRPPVQGHRPPPSIEQRVAAAEERIAKLPRNESLGIGARWTLAEANLSLDRARRKIAEVEKALANEK